MKKQHKLKRWLASASALRRLIIMLIIGLSVFLVGIALSHRFLLTPIFEKIDAFFTNIVARFFSDLQTPYVKHYIAGALLILGAYVVYRAITTFMREIFRIINPGSESKFTGSYIRKQLLSSGPNIVAIGGGTGLSTLLRGLKARTSNITAVVTVTDDGGSSGRLVSDKGILPPGDIRNCLVALADAEKTMTDLFQHRFEKASGTLSGHSVGNLLIAAMVDITGDYDHAVQEISKVLAIRGRVMPSTLDRVRLRAEMEDGSEICGETNIVQSRLRIRRIYLDPEDVKPLPHTLQAIYEADIIVLGPGSVYTSVIPPLLVPGIVDAIVDSTALKIYICNVMTQPGETDGFTASDHIHAIEANVGKRSFDQVLLNKALPSQFLLKRYAEVGQEFVEPDVDRIRAMGLRAITANLISETDLVRHDPARLADSILRMAQ